MNKNKMKDRLKENRTKQEMKQRSGYKDSQSA